jgi:hypothetical protein
MTADVRCSVRATHPNCDWSVFEGLACSAAMVSVIATRDGRAETTRLGGGLVVCSRQVLSWHRAGSRRRYGEVFIGDSAARWR